MGYKPSDFYEPDYIPDAQAKRCCDCAYLRGYVSWWCRNKDAIAMRKTAIPGASDCKFWQPDMELPETCCKNVGAQNFIACNKPATHWYQHNQDICSYCDEHDYQCGTPIENTNDI